MSTMSSQATSRWGPIKTENTVEGTNEQQLIGNGRKEDETEAAALSQHHSDEAASNDYEWIEEVEWGPRRDEEGYDSDQELAP
jgi:hypothetical protein